MVMDYCVCLLVFLLVFFTTANAEVAVNGQDLTLVKSERGPDVVDACVQYMERVFSYDQQLLQRITLVETEVLKKYYQLTLLNVGNNGGGLWQIPRLKFTQTQSNISTYTHNEIMRTYRIDWPYIPWSYMLMPFYSALAARLYIDQTLGYAIPMSSEIVKQGQYWDDQYTSKDEETSQFFVDIVQNTIKAVDKKRFVVEVIYVVGLHNLDHASAISKLFRDLTLQIGMSSPFNRARVGFVLYNNTKPFFAIEMYKYSTLQDLVLAVESVSFNSSTVNWINEALEFIYDNGFHSHKSSDSFTTTGVPKVVVVVTDMEIEHEALRKSKDVFTFIYSLRNSTDVEDLQLSFPNILARSSIEYDPYEMDEFKEMVFYRLRKVSPEINFNTKVHDTLKPEQVKYFHFPLTEDGLTLKVHLVNSSTTVYASGVIPNPNSAVYSVEFSGPIKEEAFMNYSAMLVDHQYLLLDGIYLTVENYDNKLEAEFEITAIIGNDIGIPTSIESFSIRGSDSGSELLIECTVIGNPDPEITFYKKDTRLDPGLNRIKVNRQKLPGHRVLAVLELELPTGKDSGFYSCHAMNELHNTSVYETALIGKDVVIVGGGLGLGHGSVTADIATNIRVHVLDSGHVMVSWSPPKEHIVKKYVLFYRISHGINCTNTSIDQASLGDDWNIKTTNETSLILDHELVNGCTYEFKVRSILESLSPEDLPSNNVTVFISYSNSKYIPDNGPKAIALLSAAILLLIFIMIVMGILLGMQGMGYIKMIRNVRQKMVKDLRDMQRLTEHALKIEEADEEDSIKSNTTESN